jgi:CRP-like cAMP-binding protein
MKKDICPKEETMLHTNQSFLMFIEELYKMQSCKEEIVIKRFSKGQRLLLQGERLSRVLILREGITKCFFYEDNDKAFILEFLGRGEGIGEIELIRNIPCLCSVEAITNVEAYSLSIPFVRLLLEKDLNFNHLLINMFAGRIINTSSRASFQQLYTVEHSLSKLLELQFAQNISLSKEDMAAYLGVTVRSLNRALRNLKKGNL